MRWQPRRRLSAAETAANEAARKAREKAAMTCQVCGRKILANTGRIAHHGYQRPGDGWQTASCGGAKELPFEVNRDALGAEIAHARAYVELTRKNAAAVKAEESAVAWSYTTRDGDSAWARSIPHVITDVTRANFEQLQAEKPEAFKDKRGPFNRSTYGYDPFTFDVARDDQVAQLLEQADRTEAYANQQQDRFDKWKQTHERRGDGWVRLRRARAAAPSLEAGQ